MANQEYWNKRLETRIADAEKRANKLSSEVAKIYMEQIDLIEQDINKYINEYQVNEVGKLDAEIDGMSALEYFHKNKLTPIGMKEYRDKCDDLLEKFEKATGTKKDEYMAMLRTLRTQQQVTIWKAMQDNIKMDLIEFSLQFEEKLTEFIEEEYVEAYTYTHYQEAIQSGVPYVISKPNREALEELLSITFSGSDNFSETIWKNSQSTISLIQDKVKSVVTRGKSVKAMARELKRELKETTAIASTSNCRRIINTESAKAFNQARVDGLKEHGYKTFKVLAEKDSKTCKKCEELDGKEFPIDAQILPAHPNCRCSIISNMDDGTRYSKDEKYYVYENVLYTQEEYDKIKKTISNKAKVKLYYKEDIANLSYKKYKEKYVE